MGLPIDENWLLSRRSQLMYWNDDYAIVLDFSRDGRVIGFVVFRERAD